MNLRKLLCGLLAVCLLLTMAPAALMEAVEAPVGEVVEEIGEAAQAQDLTEVKPADADPAISKNTDVTMKLGGKRTLTYDYQVISCSIDAFDAPVKHSIDGNKVTLTAVKAGSAVITVKLGTLTSPIYAVINVTVKGNSKPDKINIYDADGFNITGETKDKDLADSSFYVISKVFAADDTMLDYGVDYEKVIWSSSNTSVANVSRTTDPEIVKISLKKAGKATITATVKGTAVKASITVKLGDEHKPTKVEIESNVVKLTNGTRVFPVEINLVTGDLYNIDLWAKVAPYDYEYPVTWTVSNTKYAYFKDTKGNKVKSIKVSNGNVGGPALPLYLTGRTGDITVTAKVYNGKKATLKVKLFKTTGIKSVQIGLTDTYNASTILSGRKYTDDQLTQYTKVEWKDYGDATFSTEQEKVLYIYGYAFDYYGLRMDPSKSTFKWTSSDSKVAKIEKYAYSAYGDVAKITMKKTGKTTITLKVTSATGVSKKSSFTLEVKDSTAPKAIYFTDENDVAITSLTMKKGQKAGINVVAEYVTSTNPNQMISYSQLKFSTSDKYVATVSDKGIITAVKKGTAYIKVKTYNGLTKKLKVVVK